MAEQTIERGPAKRARLWNDGTSTFDYEIMGTRYVIEPGKSIECARRTAIAVRGFNPGKNVQVSLRIEPIAEGGFEGEQVQESMNREKVVVYGCPECDAEYKDKLELAKHVANSHPKKQVFTNKAGA